MFRVSKPPLRRLRQGLPDRGRTLDDLIPLLRRAWTGEPFEHRGTTVRVTPTPVQDPMPIYVGGASRRGVERAVRLADGYFPPGLPAGWRRYRALTIDAGRPDPGEFPPSGPIFLWVTTEPKEQVWEHLAPPFGTRSTRTRPGPSRPTADQTGPSCPPGTSRAFVRGGAYEVMNPDEALELAQRLGPGGRLSLNPLLAGIDPALAWEMLDLFDREVLSAL